MELRSYLGDARAYVWRERFAVVKSRNPHPEALANIVDRREITVVVEQSRYDEESVIEASLGWRVLTFDAVIPFETIGFLARVAGMFAEKRIPILVFSSYSTDHILVKEEHLERALELLREQGVAVEER